MSTCSFATAIHVIDNADKAALDELSARIEKRRYDLGIGLYCRASIYLVRLKSTQVVAYVGSTTRSLHTRWQGHLSFFKTSPNSKWASFVADNGGPEKFRIELVEKSDFRTREELLSRERHFIAHLRPICNIIMTALIDQTSSLPMDVNGVIDQSTSMELGKSGMVSRQNANFSRPFEASSPKYKDVATISSQDCVRIFMQRKQAKIDSLCALAACKHVFDHYLTMPDSWQPHKSIIFDKIMRCANARRVFVNKLLWHDATSLEKACTILGPNNPFPPEMENPRIVFAQLRQLCQLVGMNSSFKSFTTDVLDAQQTPLQPLVHALGQIFSVRWSASNDNNRNMANNIANIFKNCLGFKMGSRVSSRRQVQKNRKYSYEYTVLQCEPFLH